MASKITDIGNVRKINEDTVDIDITSKYKFYVVCDGVGGHKAGEIASSESVNLIKNYIREFYNKSIAPHILESAILKANKELLRISNENEDFSGMGTTITCALDAGKDIFIAHVGDSSAFLINNNTIKKITKDHSLVQQLVDEGTITESQMATHPNKNVITRSLGSTNDLKIDITEINKKDFEHIILCTDGLSDYVKKEEMLEVLKTSKSEDEFLKTMVKMAKERGGKDNISLLIFGGKN